MAASILTLFAIAGPVVIGSAGMALDMSQAYLVRERLSHALDAAALAAAALASTDEQAAYAKLQAFMNANYPPEKLGATYNLHMDVDGDFVNVSANADYDTFFLWILGIEEITVYTETTVQKEVQGLEVVMVLDNTGSMAEDNNIQALKEAARNFINILFAATSNPNAIKIGMVPYSNAVRVGRYGIGQTPSGAQYNGGASFVTLPSGLSYTTNHDHSTGWYGCVTEHKASGYSAGATHVSNSYGQLWRSGSNWSGHGWNPGSSSNDPYDYDVLDEYQGPWDIYMYGKVITNGNSCSGSGYSSSRCSNCSGSSGNCQSNYCYCRYSTPNNGCPYANVVPLTSDQAYLLSQVDPDNGAEPDDMEPHGNTLGNIGMAWGARVLSPEPPFTEAEPWDNHIWRKAIVMMTDGVNTDDSTYSAYWFSNKNQMNTTKFNNRFLETCEALKEKGVIVYTVTFGNGVGSAKSYYEDCATSASKYFDAPTQGELVRAFEQIANELSNLRITE
ncbi:MAG TPA: pilus assembly protein TadG-related protein [Alphaproteobacteria bacterium]|nr:pilus assembly protein TadG-related protein [Alphaproteobacteria bacterium]